jgi:hypothetical protein
MQTAPQRLRLGAVVDRIDEQDSVPIDVIDRLVELSLPRHRETSL